MKNAIANVLGVVLLTAVGTASAADNATPGFSASGAFDCPAPNFLTSLTFFGPGDAFVFDLDPTANGTVTARTRDCCLFGPDIWRTGLHRVGKAGKSKPGNGNIDFFSGTHSITVRVGKDYQAVVSADTIPAGFPAGMDVCIEGPVIVTAQ